MTIAARPKRKVSFKRKLVEYPEGKLPVPKKKSNLRTKAPGKKTGRRLSIYRNKKGQRKQRKRPKQIRISRDVRVTYYTRYRKGMTSTLLSPKDDSHTFESNYRTYLLRLLKHVHKGMQISADSLNQMNGFVNYLFHSLACDAARLTKERKRKTLTGRDFQNAIKRKFQGNIKIFAVLNGVETLNKYIQNKNR